ncbi:hypothetical protein GLOTRDRAFT_130493 [Gloeophyllum trabeum ATCC 11539]|uniref:F-box domain-containing protein n=1 Tax=Gloeophyllum trabeum (strain ATCC 11539 / FP-39264 / Madison 617) TaxID=670483 RepID=S7RN09_GLOTA|nr:uncharacterized protein GLOTRDRAFT_130493 [Gloeophyllum trabeum ATCC 11539]EPQ54109.1 hypothetical protein GLOTRDRAFT_130493 [Gloeophyllum trabeum ATCC 11539]
MAGLALLLEHATNLREIDLVDSAILFTEEPRIPEALVNHCVHLSTVTFHMQDDLTMETLKRMRYLREVNVHFGTDASRLPAIQALRATPEVMRIHTSLTVLLPEQLHLPSVTSLVLHGPWLPICDLSRAFPSIRKLTVHHGFGDSVPTSPESARSKCTWHSLHALRGDAEALHDLGVSCPVKCLEIVRDPRPFIYPTPSRATEDERLLSVFRATSPISLSFVMTTTPTMDFISRTIESIPRVRFVDMRLEPVGWQIPSAATVVAAMETLRGMPVALSGLQASYLSLNIEVGVRLAQMHDEEFRHNFAFQIAEALPSVRLLELGLKVTAAGSQEVSHYWWYEFKDTVLDERQIAQIPDGRAFRDYWRKVV